MIGHPAPATLFRLEKKLANDPCAILTATEVRVLDREVRRVLVSSFPGIEARLTHGEDSTRWQALGARCHQARGARGVREVSLALAIPQYRLRAIESGLLREVRADLARRYFRFLGIDRWVADWCRVNRELATRVGLLDATAAPSPLISVSTRRITKPTGWVVDMRHYLDEETGDLPGDPGTCAESGGLLRRDRGLGHRPPSAGRLADERALPAQPWSPALPRRDRRRTGPNARAYRVALPALR